MKYQVTLALILTVTCGTPATADTVAGLAAYQRGDYAKALKEYSAAAAEGDLAAYSGLGMLYEHGFGVAKDESQAAVWFRKAADRGSADGESNLGTMYLMGHGVPQDDQMAFAWFSKAAAQGDSGAEFNLGMLYHLGRGVPRPR